jgi:hypothetical protein
MADLVTITSQPIRVAQAAGSIKQPIYLATDIGGYDCLDLNLYVVLEGAASLKVSIWTGMQTQTDDGWAVAGTFNNNTVITTTNTTYLMVLGNNATAGPALGRFVRWELNTFTGGSTFATFFIRGMARRLA